MYLIAALQQFVVIAALGVRDRLSSEKGATAVEYGLMVGLIAAVIVATVAVLGGQVRSVFCAVVTGLNVVSPASCPS